MDCKDCGRESGLCTRCDACLGALSEEIARARLRLAHAQYTGLGGVTPSPVGSYAHTSARIAMERAAEYPQVSHLASVVARAARMAPPVATAAEMGQALRTAVAS